MLSEQSAATVRATLPAVGAAIGEITERFYAGLFAAHPELLRDLFNRGNQAAGTQRQALAGSIAAFATRLVQPAQDRPQDRPDAMLTRIAHKHASLGIAPEQYEVVHEHLFAAIADVLGEAVTPEVAAAWDEVYWLMANALIAIERRLYEESGSDAWREWEVVERVRETEDVVTFGLRPVDGAPVRDFRAGQYVSVRTQLPDGARQIRQYSLSGAPGADVRRISVKRVPGGATTPEGEVSNHLHARVREGSVLELSEPYGDLVLADAAGTPCSSPRPASASPRSWRCWPTSPPPATTRRSRSSTPTAPPRTTPCARTTRRTRRSCRTRPCTSGTSGRRRPRPDRSGRPHGRLRRAGHARVPVRSAAVHAGGAGAADREGGRPGGRALRGVRPGPVAGSGLRRGPHDTRTRPRRTLPARLSSTPATGSA